MVKKAFQLGLVALLWQAFSAVAQDKNIPVNAMVQGDYIIEGKRINYTQPHREGDRDWLNYRASVECVGQMVIAVSQDKKYFACCKEGLRLLASPDNQVFDCCADKEDLIGDVEGNYGCCPSGSVFSGGKCQDKCPPGTAPGSHGFCQPEEKCPPGTVRGSDGTCQPEEEKCPPGTVKGSDGTCKPVAKCSSGLQSRKCYVLTTENGHKLGLQGNDYYTSGPDAIDHRFGKFQLCTDAECKPGLPINPSTLFYMKDLFGNSNSGERAGEWLNGGKNGDHIRRTAKIAEAGRFSVTKWPCGKYCLTGFDQGLGPACPATAPALTFNTQDKQICQVFEFTEVPCDVHADKNSCIWARGGDKCCPGPCVPSREDGVECLENKDCAASTGYCNPETNECASCTSNAQCLPGICDKGHCKQVGCKTDAECGAGQVCRDNSCQDPGPVVCKDELRQTGFQFRFWRLIKDPEGTKPAPGHIPMRVIDDGQPLADYIKNADIFTPIIGQKPTISGSCIYPRAFGNTVDSNICAQQFPGIAADSDIYDIFGYLLPPISGKYKIRFFADDGGHVWLGPSAVTGSSLKNAWLTSTFPSWAERITDDLVAGVPVALRMRQTNVYLTADIQHVIIDPNGVDITQKLETVFHC